VDDAHINSKAELDAALVWQRSERIRRLRRQVKLATFGAISAIAGPVLAASFYFAAYLEDGEILSIGMVGIMVIIGATGYASVIKRRELAALELEGELKAQQASRSQAK
jgi:hypothetical protein